MAIPTKTNSQQYIELPPSYKIPWFLIIVAIPLCWLSFWLGGIVALFGLFLMLQTKTIRLQFSDKALDVYRSQRKIRTFPYSEWLNWQIFWQPVPILFYFREINSIHFLPIIFDPQTLKDCLEKHCPAKS
ncbi:DUF3119 family protein [Myxosarcina sp. GI1]|uniref:DUF3119 family protein n=1 Tax=Myxosarcina sp. GI1 TaxID=1541065 RepID=UPI00068EE877|nr:DUF3119 family protein [Myxosarcina sp. GI1]